MSRRDRYWEQRRFSDRLLDPIAWWLLNPLFRSLDKKLCEFSNLTDDEPTPLP